MSTRLSKEDMARAHLTQADLDEYDAYMAEHESDPTQDPTERKTNMAAKYAIDARFKQLDETTGLPAYPKSTAATETRLRSVQKQLKTTLSRVEGALDRALAQFEVAIENEDRKRSTQERLRIMTSRNQRIN
ncbi:hypothetical protein ACTJKK_02385 [Microbacterium sp. 22179]|uniref:hypothetical protein n=1 Tax=Microbacterium sp. 22179 TaxID=3453886 RepID=UPI003F86E3E3